ncbi:hypothetical protein FE697_018075 [Mumia zhuanghuii]|uniref:Integral membrane protein n=2 Tax=Mumia TaxID=1546255 RepID=A0ABW1QL92_9ACTN|nr:MULTISPECIES: hypothetical protein [Mumia]KAA1419815.1 hypothetical protein FE697_018075 [Mumia zhuanghuii]
MPEQPAETGSGFGRVLVAVYAVFAISATARSLVQLVLHFDEAPLAYLLSAFAAAVYIVATIALARRGPTSSKVATVAIGVELVGVLVVGTLTVLDPELFPDATVWSDFGAGYGYVPLVLPVVGMWWVLRTRARQRSA